jgi:hypothetical protein
MGVDTSLEQDISVVFPSQESRRIKADPRLSASEGRLVPI